MKCHWQRIGLTILTATLAFLFVNAAASKLVDVPHHVLYAAPPADLTPVVLPSVVAATPVPDTTVVIASDYSACDPVDGTRVSARCEDGKYVLRAKQSGPTSWIRYREPFADTVTEVTAGALTEEPTRYGVLLRIADDDSTYYLVSLQNDGKYGVFIYQGGYTALLPYTASNVIGTGTAANRLKVVNQGAQLAVYVNDQWLTTIQDERLTQGRVGLFVEGNEGAAVAYDDLRVSKINRALEIPAPVVQSTPSPVPPTQTAPPPGDTTVVIERDFASCDPIDDAFMFARCEGGEYVIHRKENQATRWIQWNNVFGDAVIEVTGRATGDALTRYGVIFRNADDSSTYYVVGLQNDGKYGVFVYDKGYIVLRPYTASALVNPGTAANRIRIVNQGPQIALYLNDQWVDTLRDERLAQGRVGLFVEGSDTTSEAAYDNLRISTINRPLDIPTPAATPSLPTSPTPVPTQTPEPTRTPLPPSPTPTAADTELVAELTYDNCPPIVDAEVDGRCEGGEFVFTKKSDEFFEWIYYRPLYGDVIVEVDTRVVDSVPSLAYGLMVRLDDQDNGYIFSLTADGEYSLYGYFDGEFKELIPYGFSDAFKEESNRLKFIAQGDTLTIYLNDEFLGSVTDSSIAAGRVALYMESEEPNPTVAFDNLRITQINRPISISGADEQADELCKLNPGEAGLLINNAFDTALAFTIGGGAWGTHDYEIPGNGDWYLIAMPPGRYTYTAFIPGIGAAHGERFDYPAGVCRRIRFAP